MDRRRLDAARRQIARIRWRAEIREMAVGLRANGSDAAVNLDQAHTLLPTEVIAIAIEQACFDFASTRGNGTLPRDGDVPAPRIQYAVLYNRRELIDLLNAAVLGELSRGTLAGTGYDSRAPLDGPRVHIPADRWAGLTVDFDKLRAQGDGFSVAQIQVFSAMNVLKARGRPNAETVSIALFHARRASSAPLVSQIAEAEAITRDWPSDGPPVPKVKTVSEHISAVWHAAKQA